jgi:hypothetical protein
VKGVGWIVILLSLLGVTYLLTRDLQSVKAERDGKVVVEPLERAKEATQTVEKANKQLAEGLDKIDR